jgi:tetratricopeptide (TPR) repeat protein
VLPQALAVIPVAASALAIAALATAMAAPAQSGAPPSPALDAARAAYLASMEGRKADTLAAVQELVARLPVGHVLAGGGSGWELAPQYAALVRFGLWDELIALTPPEARAPGLTAGYLYGRGVALAARGRLAEARAALAELAALAAAVTADASADASAHAPVGNPTLRDVLRVAVPVLAARIAATELRNADAIGALEQATAAEDRLAAGGAAGWFFPVRHLLGAQLLVAGRPAEAERVYREDLQRHPDNGWALFGLAAALRAGNHRSAAAVSQRKFSRVWKHADVRLPSSAFWFPGPDTTSCECQRQSAD